MSLLTHQAFYKGRVRATLIACVIGVLFSCSAFADDDGDASQAISEAEAATRAEILKASLAKKTYMEGLESFRQRQILQLKALELQDKLAQPSGICQTMNTQSSLTYGQQLAQAKVSAGQKTVLASLGNNTNTSQVIDSEYQASSSRFCTEVEVARGVCKPTTDPKFSNLAGADQDAMFLFQSKSGASTYDGARDGAQVDAVNGYIKRVVVGVPPEQLHQQGNSFYKKSPQARAYIELLRRYNAFLSMSAYSLNQIKESRNPLK